MTGPPQAVDTWMKKLADGSFAVGFFNRSAQPVKVNFPWRNLGFLSAPAVRDLWLRPGLRHQENLVVELPLHGCSFLRLHSSN